MMTRSCLCADCGTYPEQDIKHTGLDQETQYFACQCRSIAIDITAYQRLAIFPLARARACHQSASQHKIQLIVKMVMTRTHQPLVAMMDVAMMLVSKDSTRLLTVAMSMMWTKTLWVCVPVGVMSKPALATIVVK